MFFHVILSNSYGPLIHALPLSLADKTGGIDLVREAAEKELRDNASTVDGHSIAEDDPKTEQEKVRRVSVGSVQSTSNAKGKASASSSPVVPDEEDPHTENPPDIKPVDEDEGPKVFYHPASVDPQRVVWIPKDELGLAEEEEKAIAGAGIAVSTEGAVMDDKGHVNVSGAPPGDQVREKL